MKNWKHFRRFAAMMLVLALAVPCFGALADDSSSYPAAKSETVAALLEVQDFKFFDNEEGIGSGSTSMGVDYGVYPQARIFTVGCNLSL